MTQQSVTVMSQMDSWPWKDRTLENSDGDRRPGEKTDRSSLVYRLGAELEDAHGQTKRQRVRSSEVEDRIRVGLEEGLED